MAPGSGPPSPEGVCEGREAQDESDPLGLLACLPQQPGAACLRDLEFLSQELATAWGDLGVMEGERTADMEAVAAAACDAVRVRLTVWSGRRTGLEAACEALKAELHAGSAALGGEGVSELAAELAECGMQPLHARPAALHKLQMESAHRLLKARAEMLRLLGRTGGKDDGCAKHLEGQQGPGLELARAVAHLREDLRERCLSVTLAAQRLRGIWDDLALQPEEMEEDDRLLHLGSQGQAVTDAQHQALLGRLARWSSVRERRNGELRALHDRILALAQACLPPAGRQEAAQFLASHCRCGDIAACVARENELHGLARHQLRALQERHRAALSALGEAEEEDSCGGGGDIANPDGLRALAAAVEELELQARLRRGVAALEAARRARELWEELGEEPGVGGADGVVLRLLAHESSGEPEADVEEESEAAGSLASWQARRAAAAAVVERLHAELAEFREPGERFLAQHGTLHRKDRAACRARLRELREEARRAELERASRARLQRLCDRGLDPPVAYLASLSELRERQREAFG